MSDGLTSLNNGTNDAADLFASAAFFLIGKHAPNGAGELFRNGRLTPADRKKILRPSFHAGRHTADRMYYTFGICTTSILPNRDINI